ncbi:MAG: 30S ribosomal protein S16 [Candidatus Omnitrophica bacterium CG11_big_fil_rev_8_21_14_0_20_45_26]|uniref:Small ribosomal subunit protein bS16 n=1 Tax=Candidatus Abzuiibacterium crystallinum TaxID=1974748 RepID=A0A2H0LM70_9BACT|nr:MAG: 30S ribosomal protein S16 [Candidatus Omnitrophica bacterium CG11_big_fil_rev_8_21_14_0_20_45_26]PIW63710.1 MAG: 30S ribosomal protein S16 [Candidatus Omnitrophica bacterium CG12_big_fil_rev_8_21_14_0_65_45_16]
MVRIRLKRLGSKNSPFWRIVVTDSKMPRDGRFIEEVGYYDPKTNPATVKFNAERIQYWINVGAQPTTVVKQLFKKQGIAEVAK